CSVPSAILTDPFPDAGSGDPRSVDTLPLAAGTYGFKATVASDGNYVGATSDCEPFVVDKKQLSVSTTVHDGSHNVIPNAAHVPLGTSTHDNATVTGAVAGFPIGAISFTFNAAAIANGSTEVPFDATSVTTGALGAGGYAFNASVAGNANYIGATSDPEPFTVHKAELSVSTTVHDGLPSVLPFGLHVPLGTNAHDNATVTGAVPGFPIGAISFTFDAAAIANGSTEAPFDATS